MIGSVQCRCCNASASASYKAAELFCVQLQVLAAHALACTPGCGLHRSRITLPNDCAFYVESLQHDEGVVG